MQFWSRNSIFSIIFIYHDEKRSIIASSSAHRMCSAHPHWTPITSIQTDAHETSVHYDDVTSWHIRLGSMAPNYQQISCFTDYRYVQWRADGSAGSQTGHMSYKTPRNKENRLSLGKQVLVQNHTSDLKYLHTHTDQKVSGVQHWSRGKLMWINRKRRELVSYLQCGLKE